MWQLSYATLDFTYHSAEYAGDSTATVVEVYAQHGMDHIEGTHMQSGFPHLFATGYDGGRYCYRWFHARNRPGGRRRLNEDRHDASSAAARHPRCRRR